VDPPTPDLNSQQRTNDIPGDDRVLGSSRYATTIQRIA
jgi:hypothetical protein